MRIDCEKCENKMGRSDCRYGFRMASGAAGQTVDDIRDVYWCQDYSESNEDVYSEE